MSRSALRRWRERGSRTVTVLLPFADIMEIALALLSLSPYASDKGRLVLR